MMLSKYYDLTFKKCNAVYSHFSVFRAPVLFVNNISSKELNININGNSLGLLPLKHLGQRGILLNVIDFPFSRERDQRFSVI